MSMDEERVPPDTFQDAFLPFPSRFWLPSYDYQSHISVPIFWLKNVIRLHLKQLMWKCEYQMT